MNNDLISREALLKAMEEERQYLLARGQRGAEHIIVRHCLPIIDNAPTVEYPFYAEAYQTGYEEGKADRPKDEWIPVSDRLPQNYILCLFCDIDGDIYYGHHTSENRWYAEFLDDKIKNVIAWQPLPEPYKKGGEGDD